MGRSAEFGVFAGSRKMGDLGSVLHLCGHSDFDGFDDTIRGRHRKVANSSSPSRP
ncbi:hypothetical protein IMZ48_27110 [Candidatus Bathyarchaeota archaeon]|nr:hypothetical protein [Candidatus Bathyarchaeota archaeon]